MSDSEVQEGIVIIMVAVFFLLSALDLLQNEFFSREFSSFMAFVLVAIGVYLVTKK